MSVQATKLPASITVRYWWCWDEYRGPTEDILAAGIITPEQLPKVSRATYYKGKPMPHPGRRAPRDEHYLSVARSGVTRLVVCVGVSLKVQEQRQAERERERQEEAKAAKRDRDAREANGNQAASFLLAAIPFMRSDYDHKPGDRLVDRDGDSVTVVQAYGVHKVRGRDDQPRIRMGYLCTTEDGSELFYRAGELFTEKGEPTHIRRIK